MKNIILIPSYEPDEKLVKLINEISLYSLDIIVVNDGSSNKYNDIFNEIKDKVHLIEYTKNKGKGHALKTGLKYIKNNYKNYIVITMDSDGQHTISDALKLSEYIKNNPKELAIGSRKRNKNTPIKSKFGNVLTSIIYNLSTGVRVYDTQTGLRAFSNEIIDFMLDVKGERFEYEMNVLLLAPSNCITIKEIDIETIYIENNKHTHFNPFKDSYMVYREIIKYSLSSIISFFLDYILFITFSVLLNITTSNILARGFSSVFNYFVNKKLVFKSKKKVYNTLFQYFILAIFILTINTFILNVLINLGINKYISKLATELSLSILSFLIQKFFIFKEKK